MFRRAFQMRNVLHSNISQIRRISLRLPFVKIYPNCAECINYDKKQIDSYSRCKKFEYTNSITDEIEYEYADYARRSENMCGHDGKHYIYIPVIRHEK